ncbi:MAG: dephospho-CoA kinase [Myxococcota bacterium]|nr:dephospho-CoA kinase [bacterium]MDP6074874.1 dephospho-CoA kinase [Myxococcota bacterium]MDP6243613.1 dephospho-CoA kinase [Myxococcota bacterium]MDP7075217.1 dephospho-CoA kinase [Myxococcota bacterium]MDP7300899.1 dephospho-CoA kinase [Myxococcota bacterium]
MARPRVIGLSGGIGSGKSTVAEFFAGLGARVIDADAIVHELQAPGSPMLHEIAEAFGHDLIRDDRSLDREELGAVVFRDEEARRRLGDIVHPGVRTEMARRLAEALESGAPVIILDIPLLFEGAAAGADTHSVFGVDATVLAWVPREVQIERTVARDACSRDEAERRVASQLPLDDKRALADHVIDNSGPISDTRAAVAQLFEVLAQVDKLS